MVASFCFLNLQGGHFSSQGVHGWKFQLLCWPWLRAMHGHSLVYSLLILSFIRNPYETRVLIAFCLHLCKATQLKVSNKERKRWGKKEENYNLFFNNILMWRCSDF